MWDLLAIIAAVLFLLDVAVRRIAIDWQGARSEVTAAMQVRKVGEGTVVAWKKARDSRGARETTAGAAEAMRKNLEEGPALDVRSETKDGGAAAAAAASAKNAQSNTDDAAKPADVEENTASRLLRAKRRATGGDDVGDKRGNNPGNNPGNPTDGPRG
jgi:hypothetical protein